MKRLLLVEPDKHARNVFATILKPQESEWDVAFAVSAAEALEQCIGRSFDIVVAANALEGGRNGLSLLTELKERWPEIIRFLLVDDSDQVSLKALVGAPQQVLVKPLDLQSFTRQLNRAFMLRSVIRDPSILRLLGKAESLPPLPRVFHAVANKLNDRNASLHDVANIIAEDIVLSSKVLKLANSSLFNLRMPAGTVAQAVSLLGSRTISSLVFSQGLGDMFKGGAATERFVEEVNRHSLECASMVSSILSSWNADRSLVEKAVFCGIAHDIGKLVLAKYAPDEWRRIQDTRAVDSRSDTEIERSIIGISHAEIAAYLLAIWGFPNDQIVAIAFHHEPSRIRDREFGLLCALHLAENLVHTELHGQQLDWDYLADCRISPDDVEAFRPSDDGAQVYEIG